MKMLSRIVLLAFVVGLFAPLTLVAQQTEKASASAGEPSINDLILHLMIAGPAGPDYQSDGWTVRFEQTSKPNSGACAHTDFAVTASKSGKIVHYLTHENVCVDMQAGTLERTYSVKAFFQPVANVGK